MSRKERKYLAMNKNPIKMLNLVLLSLACNASAAPSDLKILGWAERAFLPDPGIEVEAKLDTGAETSSLDARVIKRFRKEGKRWVRFAIIDRDSGKEFILVRKRIRTIGVIQHEGTNQTRPVVALEICVGGHRMETEVSLVDRSEFNYSLLLGRSALSDFALVDPGNVFLGQPGCGVEEKDGIEP